MAPDRPTIKAVVKIANKDISLITPDAIFRAGLIKILPMEKKLFMKSQFATIIYISPDMRGVPTMQITNMLPALLNILTGQGQKKVDKAAPKFDMGEINRQTSKAPAWTESTTGTKIVGEEDLTVKQQQNAPRNSTLPGFLPLPLKSPLFARSNFYIKNDREEAAGVEENSNTNIYISLRTENIGILWLSITSGSEFLNVSFYTEKESYTSLIKESFPALTGELQALGYHSVNLAGVTRPGIQECSDIDPGGKTAGYYLLDLEV